MSFNCNNATQLSHIQQAAMQPIQGRQGPHSFQNIEENDNNISHLSLPMNKNIENKMIEQSPRENRKQLAEQGQLQLSRKYSKYRKGIKVEGQTPQARVQSKLHFILSGFREESDEDSVTYYNESARNKSSSSSSSSIHSNKRAPLLIPQPKPEHQPTTNNKIDGNNQERVRASNPAAKYLFYSEATEDTTRAKQTQQEKIGKKEQNDEKIEVDQSNHLIKRQRVVSFAEKNDKKIAQEAHTHVVLVGKVSKHLETEQVNQTIYLKGFEKLQLAPSTVALNQQTIKKDKEKIIIDKKPSLKVTHSQQIEDRIVKTPEKHAVVPRAATKSVSISKNGSISGSSQQQRYTKQPEKSSKSKASDSVEIYDPMGLRPPKKQSLYSDRYSKQPKSNQVTSKEFKTRSNQQEISPFNTISKTKETAKYNNQHYLNDALQGLIKDLNNPQDKLIVKQQLLPRKKQKGNYLRTVELQQDDDVQQHNQFLPTNIVNFTTDYKRKIKTQLSDRPEERKKVLSILKKREEALAKKVREQMQIGPTMLQRLNQYSGFSKHNSINQSQKQGNSSPIRLKNHSSQHKGYQQLNILDRKYQKHSFFDHRSSERPYFPTENLKNLSRHGSQKPREVHSEFNQSESHYTSNIAQFTKQRSKPFKNDKIIGKRQTASNNFSSEGAQILKMPNKISYYHLNKIQREHKAIQFKNATSAKEKYEKLKKLIEQI